MFNFYAPMQMCAFDKLGEKVGLEFYTNVKRQLLQLHSDFFVLFVLKFSVSNAGEGMIFASTRIISFTQWPLYSDVNLPKELPFTNPFIFVFSYSTCCRPQQNHSKELSTTTKPTTVAITDATNERCTVSCKLTNIACSLP